MYTFVSIIRSTFVCGKTQRVAARGLMAALLLVAGLRAAPVHAAEATATGLGAGLFDEVVGTTGGPLETAPFAGAFYITIDGGTPTESYCVDIHNPLEAGDTQPQVSPDYPCEVVTILNHAYPNPNGIGSALADVNREAAAVQSAIWHFTDGFVISAPSDVQTRANEIIAFATNGCGEVPAVPHALTLSPADAINYLPGEDTHSVTATLTDTDGKAVASYPIHVEITGAAGPQTFDGLTDALGTYTVEYGNTFGVPGVDTITATASFTVPVGLKFKAQGKQGIVLAGEPQPGTVTGTARKEWVPSECGDGVVNQAGEECDDGNDVNGDGCDSNCTPTDCGNGVVTEGERCDDGNGLDGDGCDSNCTPTECGNGIVTTGEQCDDGNDVNGDGCDATCIPTGCGNGVVTEGELCDDGNATNGDGCDTNCTPTDCGNGIVTGNEQCDDGNRTSGDGCDATCTLPACGNGIVTQGEQCDDGNQIDGDGCDTNCTPTDCGNGVVTGDEQCDDGNATDGDGCQSACTPPRCLDGVVDQGEQCDDGNQIDSDGCDTSCRLREICTNTIDDNGNGAIDCSDTDCGCLPILKDPAVIRFADKHAPSRKAGRPDLFKMHGRLVPQGPTDPVAEGISIVVTNNDGVVYRAQLLPGDLEGRSSGFVFKDKPALRGAGSRDGIYRAKLRRSVRGHYILTLEAYGDLSAAKLPVMGIQVGIGDDMFFAKGTWEQRRYGWYWSF